jgi:pyridoxamine 5'-phosphate oxidase
MPLMDDPLTLFRAWLDEARASGTPEPEAMAVATATPDGVPSVRMVLLKGHDEHGIVFFTNYASRKGEELESNPNAALLFHWPALGRQVRIEGPVMRVERFESEAYALSRPRASQLSALASPQSRPIEGREWLERRVAELSAAHPEGDLPVADSWGGFRLVPDRYEFWQQGPARLHDRLEYNRVDGGWTTRVLGP